MEVHAEVLDRIDDGVTEALRNEIRALVDAKYLVDDLARSTAGRRLTTAFHDGGYGPRHGSELFRSVLPFSGLNCIGETFAAWVPTAQTIGASWKWRTPFVPERERDPLVTKLLDLACAVHRRDHADIMWIQPLGLFLAHEGKNRIGFFRDMRVEWFPAQVTPYDYPARDRLAIYKVKIGDHATYWAVLDGEKLEPIHHPEWALPVLLAYGVPVSSEWPSHFPTIAVMAAAIREHGIDQPTNGHVEPVDLQLIARRNRFLDEEVVCSVFDFESAKVRSRFLALMALLFVMAVAVLAALPACWDNARIVTAMLAALPLGMGLALTFPLLKVRRSLVDPFAGYREFGSLESRRRRVTYFTG